MCGILREPPNYRTIAHSTRDDEWSQAQCLMTKPLAALAMNALVEVIRPAAPNVAPNAAVPIEARTELLIVARTELPIEVREVVQIARDSAGVDRCWRRRSQGFPSRRSPKA